MGRVSKHRRLKAIDPFNKKTHARVTLNDDALPIEPSPIFAHDDAQRVQAHQPVKEGATERMPYKLRQIVHGQNQMKKMNRLKAEKKREKALERKRAREEEFSAKRSNKRQKVDETTREVPLKLDSGLGTEPIERLPNESYRQYSLRVTEHTRNKLFTIATNEKKLTHKRREYLERRKEIKKLKKRRNEVESDEGEEEMEQDVVAFGEVAQAPPIIKVVPKGKPTFTFSTSEVKQAPSTSSDHGKKQASASEYAELQKRVAQAYESVKSDDSDL